MNKCFCKYRNHTCDVCVCELRERIEELEKKIDNILRPFIEWAIDKEELK